MNMNVQKNVSKSAGILTIISVIGLALGSSLVPAHAAVVLPVSVGITASPGTLCVGQTSRLTWSSTDATSIYIDQGIGSVLPYGDRYVSPTQTTTYTMTGTNSTGGYAVATATVYVSGSCSTPTPTPYVLQCTPSSSTVNSGELASFNAVYSYPGPYAQNLTWHAVGGYPSTGSGTFFSTRFYTGSINETRAVTVTDGYQTATCYVRVNGPTPTWTPTPTPHVDTNARIAVSQKGRNVTRGQTGENAAVVARGGDTIDIVIRVRSTNSSYVYNAYVTDILPTGVNYIAGSTTLNGYVHANGVTSSGINVGTLTPGIDTVVKFSVRVDDAYVPAWGTVTVNSTAQARADGLSTLSASLPITLGRTASIAAVSGVKTGPADSLWLALMAALMVTGGYAAYTRSDLFGRRMTLAEVSRLSRRSGLNFSK